jgi:hypothetical protein
MSKQTFIKAAMLSRSLAGKLRPFIFTPVVMENKFRQTVFFLSGESIENLRINQGCP